MPNRLSFSPTQSYALTLHELWMKWVIYLVADLMIANRSNLKSNTYSELQWFASARSCGRRKILLSLFIARFQWRKFTAQLNGWVALNIDNSEARKKINWIATWAFCGRFFSPPPNIIKLYRFFKIKSPARHNFSIFFHFPIIFQLEEAVGVKCQTWSIAKILKFCRHLQQGWKRFGLYSPDLQRWDFSNANAETIPRQAKSLFGYFIIGSGNFSPLPVFTFCIVLLSIGNHSALKKSQFSSFMSNDVGYPKRNTKPFRVANLQL